jgi:hypothetical protein
MMKQFLLVAALAASASGMAQSPAVLKESGIKKLTVFIGTWRAENDPDSTGKSDIFAFTTWQWSPNGNYLIADQRVTNRGTTTNNLDIFSYNPDKDGYTLAVVGIPGMEPFSTPITYKGDELYYLGSYMDNGGKKIYTRTVNSFLSATDYTFKVQSSEDGEHWTTSMQGKAHKIK